MIDKSNWTTKTLGEVCEIKNGKDHKPVNCPNGEYPIYGSGGIMGRATQYICEAGTTVIGRKGSINNPIYVNERFWNVDTAFGLSPKENCIPRFIYYWCRNTDFTRYNKSTTLPSLTKSDLLSLPLPVPPLSIQLRIVEELDSLSRVLARKREQLLELDNLAQALFFSFFGDPVVNEKGWETAPFVDCYKLSSGKGLSAKQIVEGEYPVYGGNGIVGYHVDYNLDGENIIIGRVGALCGNVRNINGKIFVTDNAFILTKKKETGNVFLRYLLEIHNLRQYAREGMQPVITNGVLKNLPIILPPLSLQRTFSEQVSKIEEMKRKVKASISEVQTLMDERMQRWFG